MSWLSAIGATVGRIRIASLSESAPAPIATVAVGTITVGQARLALAGAPSLISALQHIVGSTATLTDGETVANDILGVAAAIDPALIPVVAVVAALEPFVNDLVAAGFFKGITITGDPDPIHDAQVTHELDPGDPAGRL